MKSQGCYSRLASLLRRTIEFTGAAQSKAKRSAAAVGLLVMASVGSGCTAITNPIHGLPAKRLPPAFFAEPRSTLVPIDVSRLGQEPPRKYLLDSGDILGIYIEGILPFTPPDQPPTPPPVNFPSADSVQPPSLGYPIPVQEDGTISLPLIKPQSVVGMSVEQVRELIRKAYLDARILKEDGTRVLTPIVTIIQERTVHIVVIR